MSAQRDDPPFTVSAHAGFAEDGVWTIDARLEFRDGKTPPRGSRLLGDGRIELLKAIQREGLRGRALGATRARIHLDAGDGPVLIRPGQAIPEPDPIH